MKGAIADVVLVTAAVPWGCLHQQVIVHLQRSSFKEIGA